MAACSTLEEYVMSADFPGCVHFGHYFLRPQADFVRGLEDFEGAVDHLRLETLVTDAKRILGVDVPHMNAAPGAEDLSLSPPALARVLRLYDEDLKLHGRSLKPEPSRGTTFRSPTSHANLSRAVVTA